MIKLLHLNGLLLHFTPSAIKRFYKYLTITLFRKNPLLPNLSWSLIDTTYFHGIIDALQAHAEYLKLFSSTKLHSGYVLAS